MDVIQFVGSINKISFIAFIITVGFLAYEIRLLLREKSKKNNPNIPKFDPNSMVQNTGQKSVTMATSQEITPRRVSTSLLVSILLVTVIILGAVSFWSIMSPNKSTSITSQPRIIIEEIQSKGIKIFSNDWKEFQIAEIGNIRVGDTVIVGIATIQGADIDRARIRVNRQIWDTNDISIKFNNVYNVFYKDYVVGSSEAKLKIEAQLHSIKDGWLSD